MKKTSLLLLSLVLISRAAAVEPAQLELAQKVIKATQFDRMFDQMGAQMQQIATQSMNLSGPSVTPAQKEIATKTMAEVTKLSLEAAKEMLQKVDAIYAEVYSEAELKSMLAFFESPEGKSMLQKQPQVMQRMMPLVQNMQREIMPKIQQVVEKAKAEAGTGSPAHAGPALLPSPSTGGPVPLPTPSSSPGSVPKPGPTTSGGPVPLPPSGVKTSSP